MTERIIRKSRRYASSEAAALLTSVMVAECIVPSKTLWLVSPWISDVEVIDNRGAAFTAMFPDFGDREIRLGDILVHLASRGTHVVVATRDVPQNARFLERIAAAIHDKQIAIHYEPTLHEKTLSGDGYVITGSMNFTRSGLAINEEVINFSQDDQTVARTHHELRTRWQ